MQAGEWNGQWDLSVGSITITEPRLEVLSFSPPYYYTPAQFAATEASGITSIEGFAGTSVCVAAATTYLDWINGDLVLGDGSELAPVPEGIEPVVLETDALCAEAIEAGRDDFEGWDQLVDNRGRRHRRRCGHRGGWRPDLLRATRRGDR